MSSSWHCSCSQKFHTRNVHAIFFLLGNSLTSEFYTRTFRNALSVPSSYAGRYEERLEVENVEVFIWKRAWLENSLSQTFSRTCCMLSSILRMSAAKHRSPSSPTINCSSPRFYLLHFKLPPCFERRTLSSG